jgi:hypothetical protein
MATISVAIAVRDEIEENRKKQGDIIAIKEGGWQWGSGEVKNHLILEIALPSQITIDTAEALVSKYFSGGVLSVDGSAEVLAKRRFNVDWLTLKSVISKAGLTVDWKKVEDVTVAYQPLSSQGAAPGGKNASLDPTKLVMDKYAKRLIRATDFSSFITG